MEITSFDVRRYINRFIKRLEKKGVITKKIEKANYRKVRILASKCGQFRRIQFVTKYGREVSIDLDLFAVLFEPAHYLNTAYYDVVEAIKVFEQEAKAAKQQQAEVLTDVEYTNT